MKHTANPQPQRAALAAISAALLITAACANNPEPRALESSDPSPSATRVTTRTPLPTPTPTATPTPTQDLKAELYAATVKFYEALNESYKTLDTSPVRELVTEDCGACKAYIDSVDTTKEAGQRHVDVGRYIIEDFAVAKHPIGGDHQTVTFELSHTGLRLVDAKGNEVRKAERRTFKALIDFVRRDGRWLVAEQYLE